MTQDTYPEAAQEIRRAANALAEKIGVSEGAGELDRDFRTFATGAVGILHLAANFLDLTDDAIGLANVRTRYELARAMVRHEEGEGDGSDAPCYGDAAVLVGDALSRIQRSECRVTPDEDAGKKAGKKVRRAVSVANLVADAYQAGAVVALSAAHAALISDKAATASGRGARAVFSAYRDGMETVLEGALDGLFG